MDGPRARADEEGKQEEGKQEQGKQEKAHLDHRHNCARPFVRPSSDISSSTSLAGRFKLASHRESLSLPPPAASRS